MRRLMVLLLAAGCLGSSAGCFLPIYSAEPNRRAQQLIFTSEDMRALMDTWERVWFLDQPDHMTPQRIHGGVI